MKKNNIKRKDFILAAVYMVVGVLIMMLAIILAMGLYFRSDILVGISPSHLNWWIRKVFYLILLMTGLAGLALSNYGSTHLEKYCKKMISRKGR